jgi:flagellar motor switch protein FliN/FliY
VELDQAAGSLVDILVNGTVIARGDVVVVDDELGVRITEIVEQRVS